MCLEVFVGADRPLPAEGEWLVVDDTIVPGDVGRRMAGLDVVHVGAADTGCGCGFLEDDGPTPQAREALNNYLMEAATQQPIRLIVRWGGDSLRQTPTATWQADQLASLDLEVAWDHPQDISVET